MGRGGLVFGLMKTIRLLYVGVADRAHAAVLRHVASKGHRVFCAVDEKPPHPLPGVKYIKTPHLWAKLDLRYAFVLRKIIKRLKVNVVFAVTSKGLSATNFACRNTNVKIVGYRGANFKPTTWDISFYLSILNPRVDKIVLGDEYLVELLAKRVPREKLVVARKPFDVAWCKYALVNPAKVKGVPEGKNCLRVAYSAMTKDRPCKGLRFLLEAMEILAGKNVHLIFVGDYEEKDRKFAETCAAGSQIHLVGVGDGMRYVAGCDVFVLPSTRDASPRCVREAMACGLPCIVSDIDGARDLIVNHETGLLVAPGNPQQIADAITFFLENEDARLRFGKASRERIVSKFSLQEYLDIFMRLFSELVEQD
ncbi:MAG: glycosyltransferase [Opitutae bacterium]|nr:glycosyltransferase [Opitutae bacterium]